MTKARESKRIFVHIPKTGGTSINCDMNGTEWQTKPDFNYRHIIYQTKCSNSGDIFDSKLNSKYKGCEIFMMLRDPIDRLFSEYYFLRDRPEFFSLLSKKPANFYEYCLLPNTQNGMIKFLLGKKIYTNMPIYEKHFKQVQSAVLNLPIRVGIFEKYADSLSYFSECFSCDWSSTIDKKRMTLSKPDSHNLDTAQIEEIKALNKFDYMLYAESFELLSKQGVSKLEYTFTGTKYDYVLKYTERFVLIEGALKNKLFISNNRSFFDELNKELRKDNLSGKAYVDRWNHVVIDRIKSTDILDSDVINDVAIVDGLDQTYGLASLIDSYSSLFNSCRL